MSALEYRDYGDAPDDSRVDLPSASVCIQDEPDDLAYASIEVHYLNKLIDYGSLLTLDGQNNELTFQSDKTNSEVQAKFCDIRLVLFIRELHYQLKKHPVAKHSSAVVTPDSCQPYIIKYADGEELRGDSVISFANSAGLHLFKVIASETATRLFIPATVVEHYEMGQQIGTILQNKNVISDEGLSKGLVEQKQRRSRPLGEYLKEQGIVTDDDLKRVLTQQDHQQGPFPRIRLGELLISENLITEQQLENALKLQNDDRSKRLGDILVDIGATTSYAVYSALAHKLGIPFIKLKEFEVDPEVLSILPHELAKKHNAMPLMLCDGYLVVAISEPARTDIVNILSFATNRTIELTVACPEDISWAIDNYYGRVLSEDIDSFDSTIKDLSDSAIDDDPEVEKLANERPIVKLVQNILIESIKRNASDIHIRPMARGVEVLFRIHGKLTHIRNFGKTLLPLIVSRIKVIAHMDIAQRRLPQDGRIRVAINGEKKDMRVSTMPTVEGESVVVRILASAATLKPIDELGFMERDTEILSELLHRGSGLLLVTGPTGSGKSTTLYSALNVLRERDINIITVEDPVEIRLEGLEQVQVQSEIGMSFGRALRNILRHDPDVIMIGEIRDEETAKIAVQAAQTGHLVLSTLHTNSAADTIVRLREMKVESYMMATSLLGIISQRLIKKNCPSCKTEEECSLTVKQLLGVNVEETFYVGQGCDKCGNTGVSGRIPAYELLHVSLSIQNKIMLNAPSTELNEAAISWGMQSLTDCAIKYARKGETSLSEVHRIYVG